MPNQKSKARGDGGGREQKQKQKTTHAAESSKGPTKTDTPTPAPAKKSKRKDNAKPHDAAQPTAGSAPAKPIRSKPTDETPGLTAMQRGMKESLDGARFRWINEVLYKTDSAQAHQMMQEDPKVYQEYHTGFRHQVQSWPTNPVSHYISVLSSYPAKTVIADLGCGDAALARALIPKGKVVLSFDLVSDGAYVVEADTCGKLPLPGSEATDTNLEGEGHVVDVVVCALSLMGTNWLNCVREAWRILKPSGELKIAEVASRFTDVGEFTKLIGAVGFDLKSKDDRNSHFTLFEFKKEATVVKTDAEWAKLMSKGSTLKPCEYKRR
ncbi:hypothetical protein PLICRDRAFT_97193 [Plicaturopsis crispa FD-325 SS-3]|nr:hypothetical protein PLICRDRAFT_97193 [Plicaturopsis crispa FD-325 SS-3]